MKVADLQLVDYLDALKLQEDTAAQLLSARKAGEDTSRHEMLILCEHPEVVTLGRALGAADDVKDPNTVPVEVNRGGRATMHLPGQVVAYPILDLDQRGRDLHGYLRQLEEAVILTATDFRVQAGRKENATGVWILDDSDKPVRKVASLGVAVRQWISTHGLALNVCCDLSAFGKIEPCGMDSQVMTNLWDELRDEYKKTWELTPEHFFKEVRRRFQENLLEVLSRQETDKVTLDGDKTDQLGPRK